MDPTNNQQPDYSFITQPGASPAAPSPKADKKTIAIIVLFVVVVAMGLAAVLLSSTKQNVEQDSRIASDAFIQDNFITPIQARNYRKAAEFVAINDKASIEPSKTNLERTFQLYDSSTCIISEKAEDNQINIVKVKCGVQPKELTVTFRVLVGEETQSLVGMEIVL